MRLSLIDSCSKESERTVRSHRHYSVNGQIFVEHIRWFQNWSLLSTPDSIVLVSSWLMSVWVLLPNTGVSGVLSDLSRQKMPNTANIMVPVTHCQSPNQEEQRRKSLS